MVRMMLSGVRFVVFKGFVLCSVERMILSGWFILRILVMLELIGCFVVLVYGFWNLLLFVLVCVINWVIRFVGIVKLILLLLFDRVRICVLMLMRFLLILISVLLEFSGLIGVLVWRK